ncbi:MAG: DNA gyrase inhibitor YacG [Gammaproteobacteria bacterium]|nr:DNA gyrase inhibitor YacG [Gammaproteobacteria bacterium]
MKTKLNCPHCGKPAEYNSSNKWRPFCSERCRLIDLGEWMEGHNRIPSDEYVRDDTNDNNNQLKH